MIRLFGILLVVGFAWWAIQMVAAESGEVVILTTTDTEGRPHDTRLWVVDYSGAAWLRAGADMAGWYERLVAVPEIVVERNGQAQAYVAIIQLWERDTINRLMVEKYGWAEWYIGLVFDRGGSIPIRLELPDE